MKILFIAKDLLLALTMEKAVKMRMPNKDNWFEHADISGWEKEIIAFNPDLVVLCRYYHDRCLDEKTEKEFERIKENATCIEGDFSTWITYREPTLDVSFQDIEKLLYKIKLKARAE